MKVNIAQWFRTAGYSNREAKGRTVTRFRQEQALNIEKGPFSCYLSV